MGTRNLTVVKANGEIKVAQYGQWDGYPNGQGLNIIDSLRHHLDGLKQNVGKCRYISGQEIHKRYVECGAPEDSEMVTLEVSEEFKRRYPSLHRDTASNILRIIANSPDGVDLLDDLDFANDDLFCEWVYVVDLDRMVLETYDSYHSEPTVDDSDAVLKGYAVKLRRVDDINNLPDPDEFCKYFEDEDEEQ